MYAITVLGAVAAICTSMGMAAVSSKLYETSARQPEMFDKFVAQFPLVLATIELVPVIMVALVFVVLFVNPGSQDLSEILEIASKYASA